MNDDTSPDVTEDVVSTDTTDGVTSPAVEAETTEESNADQEKTRGQLRIEQAVAEKNAAETAREAAIDYGKHYKELYDASVKQNTPIVEEPTPLVAPTLESCDFDEAVFGQKTQEFYSGLIDQTVNDRVSKAISKGSEEAAQARLDADWTQRVNAYKVDNPGFDKEAFATEGIYGVIKNDPQGPQIAHELGKNPAEAQRIGLLQGTAQAMAIGEFKSKLSSKPTAKTETTKAPDPMSPVGSSETNTTPNDSESVEDYVARRRSEKAEKRGARRSA